ncbi:MAG: hypothetical protein ACYSSI_13865, partial [Planctomycetota bacterium]|jgi:hypothetical protein
MRFSNVRGKGKIADTSPDHMVGLENTDAYASRLAEVIRDQCFQLSLIAGRVSSKKRFSHEELGYILERVGSRFVERYANCPMIWKRSLPVTIKGISRETLFAMNNLQYGTDMGFPHERLSAPGLVAFSETIARVIVDELVHRPFRKDAVKLKEIFLPDFTGI